MSRVLITAGASGIGFAMAQAFHAAGHDVWTCDVGNLPDAPWRSSQADVSSTGEMASLCEDIRNRWGKLDVVCANAGIAGPTAQIEDIDYDEWIACTKVTLDGAFITAKESIPLLKEAGGGALIFTSSTAGIFGYPNRAPYAAAKWGVIGLMKTCAMELGPFGIRANAIAPGAVEGPRMEGVLEREAAAKGMTRDQVYEGYAAGTSMRTFVTAEDIAQTAMFLGSEAARRVSGQVIAVDGHTENPDPKP